jgi:hypothetical protein
MIHPVIIGLVGDLRFGMGPHHQEYLVAGGHAEVMLTHDGPGPRVLAHGHFHVAGEAAVRFPGATHETTIWSLAANQDPGNVRLHDLDTLTDASPTNRRTV